jgi:hypothetical protein
MDVNVQRYYLIQIPLKRDVAGLQLSNMGTPPWQRPVMVPYAAPQSMEDSAKGGAVGAAPPMPSSEAQIAKKSERAGLTRVAIGHGETEGPYFIGAGYRGARAEEPIRVTVVYFVTPVGRITRKDMENFAATFTAWDGQAIWGGSFVTKETN